MYNGVCVCVCVILSSYYLNFSHPSFFSPWKMTLSSSNLECIIEAQTTSNTTAIESLSWGLSLGLLGPNPGLCSLC